MGPLIQFMVFPVAGAVLALTAQVVILGQQKSSPFSAANWNTTLFVWVMPGALCGVVAGVLVSLLERAWRGSSKPPGWRALLVALVFVPFWAGLFAGLQFGFWSLVFGKPITF